ncbi:MAG TPA: sugar-binding transcriptional regulator [Sedimentisphaerales bacterium]|nr:sugar-binding transcriptional regulator [Sedimentisphaerales bacterium]
MMSELEHKRLLYKIARAYYDDSLTQQQIADRFGLSRVKVSRLLRQAREDKVVQITIASPQGSNADLERHLEEKYELKEALVVTCPARGSGAVITELGRVAAACLTRCLQGHEVLALSWGTAVLSTVNALASMDLPEIRVVQFLGGLGELEAETHGAELARRMAQTLGAKPRLIHAPGIVKDRIIRDALATDPQVADTLELAARADVAIVGIGALEPGSTLLSNGNTLTAEEVADLKAYGVTGDIALQFFDADGHKVDHPINDRIVGTHLDKIKRIERVIAVAGGVEKRFAIRAALRGRLISVLVTDDHTAKRLLE